MSDWKKVEDPVGSASESAPLDKTQTKKRTGRGHLVAVSNTDLPGDLPPEDTAAAEQLATVISPPEESEAEPSSAPEISEEEPPVIRAPEAYQVVCRKKRRRRYRFAAPLGLLVILLALTGIIALAVLGIQAIRESQDDTALKTELMDFLAPVLEYSPSPFTDINGEDAPKEALLQAAIWKVTEAERIRQLQEKDDTCVYPSDSEGRMIIPVEEITAAYASLYGPDAVPELVTIGEPGMSFTTEYYGENGTYHVPYSSSSSNSVAVADTLKKKGDTYMLRVGYVPGIDIGIDNKGNTIPPTPDMADYFQIYHLQKNGDSWMVTAISEDTAS